MQHKTTSSTQVARQAVDKRLLVSFCFISIGIGAAGLFSLVSAHLLLCLLVALMLIASSTEIRERGLDIFSPFHVITMGFVFYYVLGSLYIFQYRGTFGQEVNLNGVLGYAIIGYIGFLTGYYFVKQRRARFKQRYFPNSWYGIKFLAISSGIVIYSLTNCVLLQNWFLYNPFQSVEQIGTLTNLMRFGSQTGSLGVLFFFALAVKKRTPIAWILFCIAFFVDLWSMFYLVNTERRTVLRLFLLLLVYWHYTRRRFRFHEIALLLLLCIFGLYVLKIQQNFYYYPKELWSLDLFLEINSDFFRYYGRDSLIVIFDNISGLESFYLLIDYLHDGGEYLFGSSYYKIFLSFIPREIWELKPEDATILLPKLVSTRSPSPSQPMTIIGEFYWNFGILGVLLGMLAVGYLMRRTQILLHLSTYGSNRDNLNALITMFYAFSYPFILEHFRGSFHLINMTYLLSYAFPFLVSQWFLPRFYKYSVFIRKNTITISMNR